MEKNNYFDAGSFTLAEGKKAYFASDVHLGLYPYEVSAQRERFFVRWLEEIRHDAGILFLVGDIFDYWYEYRKVAPRGFVRFLGKLCEITDSGIPVFFFTGNHDVWVFDYLPSETGVRVFKNPITLQINGRSFFVGHGDGVGPGDHAYKLLRRIFHNPVLQYFFSKIHPNLTFALGHRWSRHSRYSKGVMDTYLGKDKEYNILFAMDYLQTHAVDYFVFGHRHIPMDIRLTDSSRLVNLGEWIGACTYGVFDGQELKLEAYGKNDCWKEKNIIRE